MSTTLHLVYGSTGEYDDTASWVVCVYDTEAKATEHARLAKLRADELFALYRGARWDIPAEANQYDPQMQVDYTGVEYTVGPVTLRDDLP